MSDYEIELRKKPLGFVVLGARTLPSSTTQPRKAVRRDG